MIQLIYTSRAVRPFSANDLEQLLARARAKNHAAGVTGCLLHVDGSFLQVLEGPPATVSTLYARIAGDSRHGSVIKLLERETEAQFPDWTMGFVDATGRARSLDGYRASTGFADLSGDPSRLLAIVQSFRDGRWRAAG